ncbi:TPA: hypothetical protein DCZ46_00235 [Candidatus Campbellbacteria bacterium]|jgi:hypothetical protein|uniref:Uncharacterized protein n=2 Tax=Candidatus Campbelliibacteriota TaxID=1752727 RepID=A0A1F5EQ27_9BACT|nr:MAG: seg [Candidatus Campbellbacteria bacterium GW2011_OD1_34_28]KKP74601.1 MAG: hypothetical protein UR74_C0003G0011 [Candidatus Campbellbacteria bacterium GW2011_GWD2_35_24]KKP76733.1 MAG: hypothetical protein UR76_C0003G0011 [Candidatus Campbellbacteria bacterium GW2011_GWC1_35_31]KKP78696.1 MAG: hypothetical protein UR79_C0003G0050 [Candidatus Campbellbacteria bacterium GW2011_GWD1_35_49]OGD68021.1 MAG: hypothetical protein A2811_02955 [Candidatus Campbellbacteria bacterium RIFCSPHIGHO2_
MGSNIKIRIIIDFLIVIFIAMAFPWWLSLGLVFLGIFLYRNFYEAFLFAFVMDSVYSVTKNLFFGRMFVYIVIVFVLFLFVRWFKERLRL